MKPCGDKSKKTKEEEEGKEEAKKESKAAVKKGLLTMPLNSKNLGFPWIDILSGQSLTNDQVKPFYWLKCLFGGEGGVLIWKKKKGEGMHTSRSSITVQHYTFGKTNQNRPFVSICPFRR